MFCATCGNELPGELKYCNRCGANLNLPVATNVTLPAVPPESLRFPIIVLGLTITIGLAIIFKGAEAFAKLELHPAAIVWIVLFGSATLFGTTGLLVRFFLKLLTLQRSYPKVTESSPANVRTHPHLPPSMQPVSSVTEHTTRTFSPLRES